MAIRAVLFDIGGVLELTPRTDWREKWEGKLNLGPGGLRERMSDVWRAGSIGRITLEEVEQCTAEILKIDRAQVDALMDDIWVEYLGTLNLEMAEYFSGLRPRYQTAILSNSFVGARALEDDVTLVVIKVEDQAVSVYK